MRFAFHRAGAIARKEWFHIRRDPFTLALALILPLVMVVVYGVAIDFNIKEIRLAVSDSDRSQISRRLVDTFGSSGYFTVYRSDTPLRDVAAERAKAAIILPPRFQKDLRAQILVDGADNSTVGPVGQYVQRIQTIGSQRLLGIELRPPYDLRTRFLFNPELNSHWFVVPGLTVVIMAILSIFLTALTVAREWENGSMELLLSTPVEPLEIIVGKATPYAVLAMISIGVVYVVARLGFDVPFEGNLFVFGLGCLLFLVTYLAQGLLISVVTRQQTIAMQLSMLTGMMPSNMLSGFIFPIASMPKFFWYLTMLLPARWFMIISRHTFLQGSSLSQLAVPFAALSVSCVLMVALAARKFQRTLE